ncbi:serine hydrolase [Streptomyces tropicalis]
MFAALHPVSVPAEVRPTMPFRSDTAPTPQTARTAPRLGGGRASALTGALLAAVTALFSAGTLQAAPATAAEQPPARSDAPPAAAPSAPPQGRPRVTTAVLDLDGTDREPTVSGDESPYDTASIIKVDILAATLLKAQDAGRPLTPQERQWAEPMIRRSDNDSANALWKRIGRAEGLAAANRRLGLTSTTGGPGPKWGLTRTTARDQIRLLHAVFDTGPAAGPASPSLTEESRAYVRDLMTRIADDQAWGVSAAADASWALKNGWLQRTASGLWDVNSVGRITAGGHHYLVAALSDGSTSMSEGVALVEGAVRAAVASASAR